MQANAGKVAWYLCSCFEAVGRWFAIFYLITAADAGKDRLQFALPCHFGCKRGSGCACGKSNRDIVAVQVP